MHPDTTDTRTLFLATPQFGFAHLRDNRVHVEPLHDFLVVQFGAAFPVATSARGRQERTSRRHDGEDRP